MIGVIGPLIASDEVSGMIGAVSTDPVLLPDEVIVQQGLNPEGCSLLNYGFTQTVPALRLNYNTVFGRNVKKRKKCKDVKMYEQRNLDAYLSTDGSRRVVKPGRRIRAQPEPM